jgi:hypothetical protein
MSPCTILALRGETMTQDNRRLACLNDAVTSTERRHVAVGIAAAFKALSCLDPPTAAELADREAASAAWKAATKALADYKEAICSQ